MDEREPLVDLMMLMLGLIVRVLCFKSLLILFVLLYFIFQSVNE